MIYKTNDEYEKGRVGWLNDFHNGLDGCDIFSAKNLLEQSKWEKADVPLSIKPSSDDVELDEMMEKFMLKGLDEGDPKHQQYSQIAMWLAELKVRRCATPANVQPVIISEYKDGTKCDSFDHWENVIGKAYRDLLIFDNLSQNKKDIAKILQLMKHLCHSMQRWLGFDERQINNMCADLNIKTRANDWS